MNNYLKLLIVLLFSFSASAQKDSLSFGCRFGATTEEVAKYIAPLVAVKIVMARFYGPYSGTYFMVDELKLKSTGQEPSFLLSTTPSTTCYSDAGNSQGYSNFKIRGIDQAKINVGFDGIPLNEPEDQRTCFSNYPDLLNSIGALNIQRGIATPQLGTASLGGSIQLFSYRLRDTSKTIIGAGYGSFNSYRFFVEHGTIFKSGSELYVKASQIQSDGYKHHSGNNSQSIFLQGKWKYKKSNWKATLLAGQQQNQLAWLGVSDSVIRADRRTNVNENENDRFVQTLASLNHSFYFKNNTALSTTVYHTFLDGNRDFNLNAYLGQPSTDELYNYAFQSNLVGLFSTYSFSAFNGYYSVGGHINTYTRSHTGSERTLGELYSNKGFKNEASLFARLSFKLNKFSISPEIQFRHVSFDYIEAGTNLQPLSWGWNFLNTKTIFKYKKNDHEVYYSFANIGREPTRSDLFGGSDNLITDSAGNIGLFVKTPEYALDHELGYRFVNDKTAFSFNLYAMYFQNELVQNGRFGTNGLPLNDNVKKSSRQGAELTFKYSPKKWLALNTNASYNYSVIDTSGVDFKPILTPPILINQEIVLTKGSWSVAIDGRFQDKSFIDLENTAVINEFFLLNSRLGYSGKQFSVNLHLYNLTNAKYYSSGYVDPDGTRKYYVQAPLNYYLSVKYWF